MKGPAKPKRGTKRQTGFPVAGIDDVTGRDLAAKRILASEALQCSILETMPDSLFMIDEAGIIRSVSKSVEKQFGYSAEEILGQSVNILMQSPDRERHDGYIARYFKTGEKRVIGRRREIEALRKDGSTFPADLMVSEITVEGKTCFTGFMHDLSERRQVELQLLQAQKMEAVGQLTGGVAHDFNNLLTVVLGNLELLEPLAGDDRQKKLIGRAKDAVKRGSQLSDRLLSFARRQPLRTSFINLNELVSGFMDMLRHTLGGNISIELKMDDKLWPVRADVGQLENAILNLVINARDAMPTGGRLMIAGKNTVLDEGYVKKHLEVNAGSYVELSVQDTGSGMPRDVLDHVFEPFFTTKAGGAGTGLGLSMVYGFVKQSNGHIHIESEVGKGTTIRLYLPRSQEVSGKPRHRREQMRGIPRSKGETILIVEDDIDVRKTALKQLKALGYEVVEAANGAAALELIVKGLRPALIFTDIMMPGGMSGVDLSREALKHDPGLKIIFVSGYAEPSAFGEVEDVKAIPILRKPYTEMELALKIREALEV
jgi:PAS domain S-box-containing protein